MGIVPLTGKEEKSTGAAPEGMENEVSFLGFAILEDPRHSL